MFRSVFLNRGLICTRIAKIRADPGSAYRYDVMLERRSILIVLLSSPETVAAAHGAMRCVWTNKRSGSFTLRLKVAWER